MLDIPKEEEDFFRQRTPSLTIYEDKEPNVIRIRKKTCRAPPTLRRNRIRDEILDEIKDLCSEGDPNDKYTIKDTDALGAGASGAVFLGTEKETGQKVAVKKIDLRHQFKLEMILMELESLKQLTHPNLVDFIEAYMVGESLWIIMEYLVMNLNHLVEKFSMNEAQIAIVCIEVLEALYYLHSKEFLHRDLKSVNILVGQDGSVKITDFGLSSTNLKGDTRTTVLGTPYWIAPEILKEGCTYGKEVDVWSFGIMVLEMVEGKPPYFDDDPEAALLKIKENGQPDIRSWRKMSPDLRNFVDRCLQPDPLQRDTVDKLLDHPFLLKADVDKSKKWMPLIKAATNKQLNALL